MLSWSFLGGSDRSFHRAAGQAAPRRAQHKTASAFATALSVDEHMYVHMHRCAFDSRGYPSYCVVLA